MISVVLIVLASFVICWSISRAVKKANKVIDNTPLPPIEQNTSSKGAEIDAQARTEESGPRVRETPLTSSERI